MANDEIKEFADLEINNFIDNYLRGLVFSQAKSIHGSSEDEAFYRTIKSGDPSIEVWIEKWNHWILSLAVCYKKETFNDYFPSYNKCIYYKPKCWNCDDENNNVERPKPGTLTFQKSGDYRYLSLYINPGDEQKCVETFFSNNDVRESCGLDKVINMERLQQTWARIGQGKYRDDMLEKWGYCCAVTGCSIKETIIASHAKPWKDAEPKEKTNWHNGLPLSADLDALFDKGLITFDENWKIYFPEDKTEEYRKLGVTKDMSIRDHLNDADKKEVESFLKYHRKHVYKQK